MTALTSHYPISFYLRQISSEYLDRVESSGNGVVTQPTPQLQTQINLQSEKQNETKIETKIEEQNETSEDTEPIEPDKAEQPTNQSQNNSIKKKPQKKKRTDIMDKVNRLKEDMQNKSC